MWTLYVSTADQVKLEAMRVRAEWSFGKFFSSELLYFLSI